MNKSKFSLGKQKSCLFPVSIMREYTVCHVRRSKCIFVVLQILNKHFIKSFTIANYNISKQPYHLNFIEFMGVKLTMAFRSNGYTRTEDPIEIGTKWNKPHKLRLAIKTLIDVR